MRAMHMPVTVAFAVLLSACAGPSSLERVTESQSLLDSVPDCCATLADANRQPLPLEETTIKLGKLSQATRFNGRKAFFALLELPPFARDYSIYITSLAEGMQGGRMGSEITILVPHVALYDRSFKQTRTFEIETLRNRGTNLERAVFINSVNKDERYLAIYASELAGSVERSVSVVNTATISLGPGIYAPIHTGHDGKLVIRSSPTGTVTVEVRGLGPQKAAP